MRPALLALLAALLCACGTSGSGNPDAGAAAACLERPTDLARAPSTSLPCDLLPPK